jgi:hypothetical protein
LNPDAFGTNAAAIDRHARRHRPNGGSVGATPYSSPPAKRTAASARSP